MSSATGLQDQKSGQQLFVLLVPAVIAFALGSFSDLLVNDGDVFWHIKAGEWMIDHGAVIRNDPFSYTFANQPWNYPHEWLSEVIMAAVYRAGGWSGLSALVSFSFAATAFLLYRELLKHLQPLPALYIGLFAFVAAKGAMLIRPHFFVLPLLIIWVSELVAARREDRAPRWIFLPLLVLWANLHGSFVLGIALAGAFAIEAMLAKPISARWGAFFAGAVIAGLVTPHGIDGLLFPLQFTGADATAFLQEWQPNTFDEFGEFELSILAGSLFALLIGLKLPLIRALTLLWLFHMALAHRRFALILFIVGPIIVAERIAVALKTSGWELPRGQPINPVPASMLALSMILAIVAAVSLSPRSVRNNDVAPMQALAAVPASVLTLPALNDFVFGGYMIFTGTKPFIDGRAELYGAQFVGDYVRLREGNQMLLDRALEKYGIEWTIFPPPAPINAVMSSRLDWCESYRDVYAVVFMRASNGRSC